MEGEEGKGNLLEIGLPQAHFRHITHKNGSLWKKWIWNLVSSELLRPIKTLKSRGLPQECLCSLGRSLIEFILIAHLLPLVSGLSWVGIGQ